MKARLIFAAFAANALLILVLDSLLNRPKSYKGVRNITAIVRNRRNNRWLKGDCLPFHGSFCGDCGRKDECWKELEMEVMKEIDDEQEGGDK